MIDSLSGKALVASTSQDFRLYRAMRARRNELSRMFQSPYEIIAVRRALSGRAQPHCKPFLLMAN
jgi:hypothetical protein